MHFMTKEEGNKIGKEIYTEYVKKHEEIEQDAKSKGIWKKGGLDTNQYLFRDLWLETCKKLQELRNKVDEM